MVFRSKPLTIKTRIPHRKSIGRGQAITLSGAMVDQQPIRARVVSKRSGRRQIQSLVLTALPPRGGAGRAFHATFVPGPITLVFLVPVLGGGGTVYLVREREDF
ncbi:MAG: hypothetical protein WBE37_11345 [Bryobacteraceae bacterium]